MVQQRCNRREPIIPESLDTKKQDCNFTAGPDGVWYTRFLVFCPPALVKELSNVKIVLVNTSHPGNIGASARAMKNMGLNNLALVEPKDFPSGVAVGRAASAVAVSYTHLTLPPTPYV